MINDKGRLLDIRIEYQSNITNSLLNAAFQELSSSPVEYIELPPETNLYIYYENAEEKWVFFGEIQKEKLKDILQKWEKTDILYEHVPIKKFDDHEFKMLWYKEL